MATQVLDWVELLPAVGRICFLCPFPSHLCVGFLLLLLYFFWNLASIKFSSRIQCLALRISLVSARGRSNVYFWCRLTSESCATLRQGPPLSLAWGWHLWLQGQEQAACLPSVLLTCRELAGSGCFQCRYNRDTHPPYSVLDAHLHQLLEAGAIGISAGTFLGFGNLSATACNAWDPRSVCSPHESVQRCLWGWGECPNCMGQDLCLRDGAADSLGSEGCSHIKCNSHQKWHIQQINWFRHKLGSWSDCHTGYS